MPLHQYEAMGEIQTKIPTEVLISERREFELASPEGEHAVVVSIAPGFGQPRPNRRGEARGLHVYESEAAALRVRTYIWREDGWGLTAVRVFPRGRQPLSFESLR